MNFLSDLCDTVAKNPTKKILLIIKGQGLSPFASDLQGLDLSDCISVFLLNSTLADKLSPTHAVLFDFVHCVDLPNSVNEGDLFWQLNSIKFPKLEKCLDEIVLSLKNSPDFDINQLRLVILEEFFVRAAAAIRGRHGIPGPNLDDINRFSDKAIMKQVAQDGNLPMANFLIVTPKKLQENRKRELEELIGYPIMFKPFHGVGSAGIEKFENSCQLQNWLSSHPDPDTRYVAEEYINGKEYRCVALVQKSGTQLFPAPYYIYGDGVWTSIRNGLPLCTMIETDPQKQWIVENFIHQVLDVFHPPNDGVAYVQTFMTSNGDMKFSEIAYRIPGRIGTMTFTENCGISTETVQIMAQKQEISLSELSKQGKKRNSYFATVAYPKREGVIKLIRAVPERELNSKVEFIYCAKAGERTKAAKTVVDLAIRIYLWNDDNDRLTCDLDWLIENYHPLIMEQSNGQM